MICNNEVVSNSAPGVVPRSHAGVRRRWLRESTPAGKALRCRLFPLLWLLAGAGSGCASTIDDRWLVAEIHEGQGGGIRLHDASGARYIVGGDPQWKWVWAADGKAEPRWAIPTFALDPAYPWPWVPSGDLSTHGELALARRATYSGASQIFDVRDGRLIAQINTCPLAVQWSNDGETLAVVEWLNPVRRSGRAPPTAPDEVRVALYDRTGHQIRAWPLELEPSRFGSSWENNAFVVSWNREDTWFLVSTKKALRNPMRPKLYLINPKTGPVSVAAVSDAYFLDSARFVGNDQGKWSGASFYLVSEGHVRRKSPVGRRLFAAGSCAQEGVFLAYTPPGPFPMLRFALPVVLLDSTGKLLAKDDTGYAYGSSLRMIYADSPLADALRRLAAPLGATLER